MKIRKSKSSIRVTLIYITGYQHVFRTRAALFYQSHRVVSAFDIKGMTAKRDVGTGVRLLVGTTTNIMTKWTLLCLAVLAACRVGATVFKIPNESGMDPGADLRRRMEQQRRILRKVEVRPLFTEKNNNFRICSRYEWKRR